MRWGAMLMACMMASAVSAAAGEPSPVFGGDSTPPFQVAVNPATGQPLQLLVPGEEPALQATK
jgi:hypothetical protein